jgi:hypothetical protein
MNGPQVFSEVIGWYLTMAPRSLWVVNINVIIGYYEYDICQRITSQSVPWMAHAHNIASVDMIGPSLAISSKEPGAPILPAIIR